MNYLSGNRINNVGLLQNLCSGPAMLIRLGETIHPYKEKELRPFFRVEISSLPDYERL